MSYKMFFVLFFLLTIGGCKETKVNPANERIIEEIDSVISQWENDEFFKLHPTSKRYDYYYHVFHSLRLHYSGNQFAMDGLLSEREKYVEELKGFAERAKSISTKSHIEISASRRVFDNQITNARLSACLDGIQCIKARLRNTSNHITAPQKLQYTISIIQASENVNEFHAFVNRGVEFYIEKSLSRGEFIDVEFPVLLDAHWDKPYNISIQLRDKALHFHNYYLDTLSLLAPSRKEYAKHAVVNYDDVIALESELLIKRKEVERLVKMAIPLFKILKEANVDTRRFSLDTQSDQKLDFIFHVLINAIDRNEIEIEGFELSVAELDSLYYNILLDKV